MSGATAGPVRVKICGITRREDALAAARAGADAVGVNFWPGSKRFVEPETAAEIIAALPPFVTPVGVFVNQPRAQIVRAARVSGVALLQLHGDESPEDASGLPLPVIKAFRADAELAPDTLARYAVAAYLVDAPSAGFGGSGRTFDWTRLRGAALPAPLVLAGGLTPDNVADAVRAALPYAVDVASGVETAPGIKDEDAMRRFVAAARRALDGLPPESQSPRARSP